MKAGENIFVTLVMNILFEQNSCRQKKTHGVWGKTAQDVAHPHKNDTGAVMVIAL